MLLRLHSNHPPRFWHHSNHAPELQPTPETSNTLSLLSKNPDHISVFICLHHSVLVLLNSNLIFTPPSQFSSFHFWYITSFQYSCSLVLAPALPSYISASLLLNSCNPLYHSLVQISNHLLSSTSEPPNLQTSKTLTLSTSEHSKNLRCKSSSLKLGT